MSYNITDVIRTVNDMTLGEKIKNARIKSKKTQSELCEDKISRNMLSQIENGKANPSLDTVRFIADKLSLPLSYFFSDSESDEIADQKSLVTMKERYKAKDYGGCLSVFGENAVSENDESCLLCSLCYLKIAEKYLHDGEPSLSLENLGRAAEYAQKTIYPTDDLMARVTLLSAVAANVQSPRLELEEDLYLNYARSSVDIELYKFISDDTKYKYDNSIYATVLDAKVKMKSLDYQSAANALSELDERKVELDLPAYILFRIYGDLEICYRELKSFELAYKYSSKRVALLSAFNT